MVSASPEVVFLTFPDGREIFYASLLRRSVVLRGQLGEGEEIKDSAHIIQPSLVGSSGLNRTDLRMWAVLAQARFLHDNYLVAGIKVRALTECLVVYSERPEAERYPALHRPYTLHPKLHRALYGL